MPGIRQLAIATLISLAHIVAGAPDALSQEKWRAQAERFDRVGVEDGLSHNSVYAIAQDHDGYIWLGTPDGLNRFDGYNFVTLRSVAGDTTSLSSNLIESLLVDRSGRLWVGTATGLDRMDDGLGPIVHIELDPGRDLSQRFSILDLYEDKRGAIWAATTGGLFSVMPDGSVMRHDVDRGSNAVQDKFGLYFLGVVEVADGMIAKRVDVSSDSTLYYHLNAGTSQWTLLLTAGGNWSNVEVDDYGRLWGAQAFPLVRQSGSLRPAGPGVADERVRDVILTDKTAWLGTGAGLIQVDLASLRSRDVLMVPDTDGTYLDNFAQALFVDAAGGLWVGTHSGAYRHDPNAKQFRNLTRNPNSPNTLAGRSVSAIFVDEVQETVWVGTFGSGLSRVSSNGAIRNYSTGNSDLCGDNISAVHKSISGKMWIVADGFLCSFGGGSFVRSSMDRFGTNAATAMVGDDIWIAAGFGGEVLRYSTATEQLTRYSLDSIDGYSTYITVESFAAVSDSVMLLGTNSMVVRLDPRDGGAVSHPLVSTAGSRLESEGVWDIHVGDDGIAWLASGAGLSSFDTGDNTFVHYATDDGLPGSVVYSVLPGSEGELWLGTNNGLSRFQPAGQRGGQIRTFSAEDGTGNTEYNRRARFATSDGELFFGGMNGLTRFRPSEIVDNRFVPPVVVTRILLSERSGDVSVPVGASLTVPVTTGAFSFEFSALNFLLPSENDYRYKLLGYDNDWIDPLGRTARYTRVPPGRYTFQVRGSNNDGLWNDDGVSLAVFVEPRFYQTIAFRLLGTLLLIAVAVQMYRSRVNRIIRTQQLAQLAKEKSRADEEARRLAELDSAKSRFFANISHEFRTPLTLIVGPIESWLQRKDLDPDLAVRDKGVLRNANRLLNLVNQLLDLSKLESGQLSLQEAACDLVDVVSSRVRYFASAAERADVTLAFRSDDSDYKTVADADKVSIVVDNLISNAIKFTQSGGKVWVTLTSGDENVRVTVRDTGIGIDQPNHQRVFERFEQISAGSEVGGTGIGLAIVKELVQMMDGTVILESEVGFGSSFSIQLPLRRTQSSVGGSRHERTLTVTETAQTPETRGSTARPSTGPTVVVVDDDAELREFIASELSDFDVRAAGSGSDGLDLIRQCQPEIVICDVMMTGMDGYEVLETLRAEDGIADTPFILLTARADEASVIRGLECAADDYISKPFSPQHLRARINNLVASRTRLSKPVQKILLPDMGLEAPGAEAGFVAELNATIQQHISDSFFGVSLLAESMGTSRRALERRMADTIGTSPAAYLRRFRLAQARHLLEEGAGTVADVASFVGFRSPSHFSAVYKKEFGISPSAVRGMLDGPPDP